MRNSGLIRRKPASHYLVILTLLTLLFSGVGSPAAAQDSESIDALRQMGKAFAGIAEKTSSAVVGLESEKTVTSGYQHDRPFSNPFEDDFFDHFFRRNSPRRQSPQPRTRPQVREGSGFIISSDGYILTNNHLVEQAEKVTIKLSDGREFKDAEIIGTDPESDVAVVKIDADNLPFLELADSDTLEVGEWVLAIGNPFGLSHTVTAGIVSAIGRKLGLNEYEDFIQTDAAINPGNSGGPLVNLDGKAVGISTAIISRSGGNLGIGLAIPINMARSVYEQLVEGGKVVRGALGVYITDLTADMAESLDLKDVKGVVISDVIKDSAAEKAGMKRYDVVVELEGAKVEKANELHNRIAMLRPGTKVKLVVIRDGKRKTLTAKLGERPTEGLMAAGRSEISEKLGLDVENLTDDLARRFGYEGLSGVVVTKVEQGSLAAQAGIRSGLLIQEVSRKQVLNIKEFNEAIEEAGEERSVLLLVSNGRYSQLILLSLPEK